MPRIVWIEWETVSLKELEPLLHGFHPHYKQLYLLTNWIKDPSGAFTVKKNVIKKGGNPRITGKLLLVPGPGKKGGLLATETLRCQGRFGCHKIDGNCGVKMKLEYYDEDTIKIYFNTRDHGPKYSPIISKLRVANSVKNQIIEKDSVNGSYSTTSIVEYMRISVQNGVQNIPANNSGALPTTKQIQNILYYNRRKDTSNNEIVNLQNFIDDSDSVVYPKQIGQGPLIIILKCRSHTIRQFISSHRESKISGMDTQFANNKYNLPVTVFATQTVDRVTVPAYVGLFDTENYSFFIKKIMEDLLVNEDYDLNNTYLMIDKDEKERQAGVNNNLKIILCEFHAVRIFERKIKEFYKDKEEQLDCLEMIKNIQRSRSENAIKTSATLLQKWANPEFWQYFSDEWLCKNWASTWIDGTSRPGGRLGI